MPDQHDLEEPTNPLLYQINTRIWLNELSRALGRPATFRDVSNEYLDQLAALGFDWIWPLGVWQTGPLGREVSMSDPGWQAEFRRLLPDLKPNDITGSPYAVRAYRVHEDFGGDAALADLRWRLKQRGLRLLLDFVPNHTARDHSWVGSHPEYYVAGDEAALQSQPQNYATAQTRLGTRILAYGRDPYFPGWPDTFQLNYRSRACREAMAAQLAQVATFCDGVRCDMAMLLLPDVIERTWGARARPADGSAPVDTPFWPAAIAAVRASHPSFVFMAEVYWDREWDLQQQGFDYTYDKRLYDRLRGGGVGSVRGHLLADREFQRRSARFLENHDEPRAAATFPAGVHQAAAVVTFGVPGLRFFHEGQLEGRRCHVPMHLGRRPAEPIDERFQAFYRRLLETLRLPAMRAGHWQLLPSQSAWPGNPTADNVLAFSWQGRGGERLLITANYAGTQSQAYVRLPWADLRGATFRLADRLSDVVYVRSGDDLQDRGLYLDVPAWHPHIFEITRQ